MDMSLNLDLVDFKKPKNRAVFNDSANNWQLFMSEWSKNAYHGEYAVIRQLDLSDCDLNHFPADHIAFVQCNLDGVSFRSTEFSFETAFINCSMKHVDFASTFASDALFVDCDLTGAKFWIKMGWVSVDLDGKTIPSVFTGCKLDPETEDFLLDDGCLTDKSKIGLKEQLKLSGNLYDKLLRIIIAPQINA